MKPINGQVLSTYLPQGIADWAAQNEYFVQIFDNISSLFRSYQAYYRIDTSQGELNGFSTFFINSDNKRQVPYENGQVGIKMTFYLGEQREQRGLMISSTIASVRSQLLCNPVDIREFVDKDYVPGLLMLNTQNTIDNSAIDKQLERGDAAITGTLVLEYCISILLNQRALWANGNDFYSPVTKIYKTIKDIEVKLQILPNSSPPFIVGYTTNPNLNYTNSGILFLPEGYQGNGYLLGNNGNVVESQVLPDTPPGGLRFLYIEEIDEFYPATGMLIVGESAQTGNAAILLGDDGNVYELLYNADVWLSPIYNSISRVLGGTDFPVDGILLTRVKASSGNAAILFGADLNIYNVEVP